MAQKKAEKNLREIIDIKVGKEILRRIQNINDGCFNTGHGPILFPPIPDSKYIDKLPEGIPLEGQNASEKECQDGFVSEVKLYRCFESLDKDIVVLHQLDYTYEQYAAFIPEHICQKRNCRKLCVKSCTKDCAEHAVQKHLCHNPPKNIEGECDFVAIGSDFVAVFEVKGLQLDLTYESHVINKMYHRCCNDALKQRKRMVDLLTSIDRSITLHDFTVLSNIYRKDAVGSQANIVFKDDLDDFAKWFDENISSSTQDSITVWKTGELMKSLFGIWCIDIDNRWDFGKYEITQCINDVNGKLLRAHVTRKSYEEFQSKQKELKGKGKQKKKNRKYPENDLIRNASEIFNNYLSIDCLTCHQQDVFDSDERLLWVDGPAGSGKTIVMLGKIIQFAIDPVNKSLNRKAVLVLPDYLDSTVELYHQNLFNCIQPGLCATISAHCDEALYLISQCCSSIILLKTQFMGIDGLTGLLCALTKGGGHHIFIDDLHLDIVVKELRKLAGKDSYLDVSDVGILYSDVLRDRYKKIRSDQNKKDMLKTSFSFQDNHGKIITKTVNQMIEQNEIKGKVNVEPSDNCRSMEWAAVIAILIEKNELIPSLYLAASRARVYCSIILVGNAGFDMTELMKEIEEEPGLCKIVQT
ncbi:hypothetical protein ACHWQZ_G010609 [Mnemiopsis leidyi]